MYSFWPLLELQPFEDWFFLVTPIHLEAHAIICVVEDIMEGRCIELFLMYRIESHLLMGNNVYVYKEEGISDEDIY